LVARESRCSSSDSEEATLTELKARTLLNLTDADLDRPVYRIYPINRFVHLLSSGRDALVNPSKWDDPFENFLLDRTEALGRDGERISLVGLAGD
jgi:hypothetical protein